MKTNSLTEMAVDILSAKNTEDKVIIQKIQILNQYIVQIVIV